MNQPLAAAATLDLRRIAPRERHALIFSSFDGLADGQALELVNDHDPQPLQRQFEARSPGRFAWSTLEAGPEAWRVRIAKLARAAHGSNGQCCGSCGGI